METQLTYTDIAGSDGLSRRELELIRAQHEKLARVLTSTISAVLRFSVNFQLEKVEQASLASVAALDPACQFAVKWQHEAAGAIFLDSGLASALLELILGGKPRSTAPSRTLTDVELALLNDLSSRICAEWENTWQAYAPLRLTSEDLESELQPRQEVVLGQEQAVVATLSAGGEGIAGQLWLAMRARLLRQARRTGEDSQRAAAKEPDPERQSRMLRRLNDCSLLVRAVLPAGSSRFGELLSLQPGDVLLFDAALDAPVRGSLGGLNKLSGEVVRAGNKRGLLVHAVSRQEPVQGPGSPGARGGTERRRTSRAATALATTAGSESTG